MGVVKSGGIAVNIRKLAFLSLVALLISIFFVPMAFGQESTVRVRATWGPPEPDKGSDPVMYHLEIRFRVSKDAPLGFWGEIAAPTDTTHVLVFEKGMCYEVRVRAEDAAGSLGPFSVVSEEFCIASEETEETDPEVDPMAPSEITGPIKQEE